MSGGVIKLPVEAEVPQRFNGMSRSKAKELVGVGTLQGVRDYRGTSGPSEGLTVGNTLLFKVGAPSGMYFDSAPELNARFHVRIQNMATTMSTVGALNAKIGMQAFPLNRCFGPSTVAFGTGVFPTHPLSDSIDVITRLMPEHSRGQISPCFMLDTLSSFVSSGEANPLRCGLDALEASRTRGFGAAYKVANVTVSPVGDPGSPTSYTLDFDVELQERMMLEPFQYTHEDPVPFSGVGDVDISIAITDLRNALAANIPKAGGGVVNMTDDVSITSCTWGIVFQTFAAPMMAESFPADPIYHVSHLTKYTTLGSATSAAGSSTVTLGVNTNMSEIPSLYAIVVTSSAPSLSSPARFAPILNANLTIPGTIRQMGSLRFPELFEMSRANGYQLREEAFRGGDLSGFAGVPTYGTGSILAFRPSDIWSAELGPFAGMVETMNFTGDLTIDASNYPDGTLFTANLYTFADYALVKDGMVFSSKRVYVDRTSVMEAHKRFADMNLSEGSIEGGFFGNVANFFRSAFRNPIVRSVASAASKAIRNSEPLRAHVGDGTAIGNAAAAFGAGSGDTFESVAASSSRARNRRSARGGAALGPAEVEDILMSR